MADELTDQDAMNEAQRAQLPELQNQDWEQVAHNGGPPCFHVSNGKFCFRAERWPGHKSNCEFGHKFVSLADYRQAAYVAGAADAREQDIALAKCQAEKEEEERNFGRGNAIRMVITKLREVAR